MRLLTGSKAPAAGGGCREPLNSVAVKVLAPLQGEAKLWEPQVEVSQVRVFTPSVKIFDFDSSLIEGANHAKT